MVTLQENRSSSRRYSDGLSQRTQPKRSLSWMLVVSREAWTVTLSSESLRRATKGKAQCGIGDRAEESCCSRLQYRRSLCSAICCSSRWVCEQDHYKRPKPQRRKRKG